MKSFYEPRERSLEPEEPKVYCTCNICGQDIYDGEDYWCADETNVCRDCLSEFLENFEAEAEEKFIILNRETAGY